MEKLIINKKEKMMDTLLQGNQKKKMRENVSERLLKTEDFLDGGCYSTSAVFRWEHNRKGWKLSWGKRYNYGGMRRKYFTLYKYFKKESEIIDFLKYYKKHIQAFCLS